MARQRGLELCDQCDESVTAVFEKIAERARDLRSQAAEFGIDNPWYWRFMSGAKELEWAAGLMLAPPSPTPA